eukprot:TRINITY_DN37248_c0_g1_i1.p2 TRINITY_DN37248_c0_g1~~TRINITY_DN37248_c0_g1_i1.p2  ORF type:complete len:368 (+),score=133.54 TRINITY_DN37248_c0_g1_i1:145-1248(+)
MQAKTWVLAALVAAHAMQVDAVLCQTYQCPTGRALTTDTTVSCVIVSGNLCVASNNDNTAVCCPEEVRQETGAVPVTDDYIPLVVVNVVGAIPLGIVIALMVWSVRSINRRERRELEHLEEQATLFQEMENESMRRSHRSSMFLKSDRRKSMKLRSSVPLALAGARPMLLTLEKQVGVGMGFGVEDMVVVDVQRGSPADHAGVQNGMIVKKVEDRVVNAQNIIQSIKDAPNKFTILVMIKESRDDTSLAGRSFSRSFGGSIYGSFKQNMQKLQRFRLSKPVSPDAVLGLQLTGLEVTRLQPGGIAEQAGLKGGMCVYAVNGTKATVGNIAKLVSCAPDSFLLDCQVFDAPQEFGAETASLGGTSKYD